MCLCIERIISALQRHQITNLETLKLSAGSPNYEQVNWRGWGEEKKCVSLSCFATLLVYEVHHFSLVHKRRRPEIKSTSIKLIDHFMNGNAAKSFLYYKNSNLVRSFCT